MVAAAHPPADTPVLISGGGPVGLCAAVELSRRGVASVVVEPRREPTRSRPRAKTLTVRTMEHMRRWGLADRLRERAPLPTAWSQDVAFATTLLGPEIERFHGVLGLSDVGVSPELGQQMPQYVLEDLLREVVADDPLVSLVVGARVTSVQERSDGVDVEVVSADGPRPVRAVFVIGADGARSAVRQAIGAQYVGTRALRPNVGVVFRSDELAGRLPHPPAVQTWLLNSRTPGMMGPVDRAGTWWLIAFGVDGTAPDLDPQALVEGALGASVPLEVVSIDPWTARMELVDECRRGRVALIGDAAHLNPPFGGHGLNTGIGDAVDVGWKVAAGLAGWGGDGLLASYAAERQPLHRRVIDEAAANMATLSTELVRGDLDDPGPAGDRARTAAAEHIRATKTSEYFSLDLVLGHRYADSPILPTADEPDDDWAHTALPGRRLPHVWVAPGTSTLDLVGLHHTVLLLADLDLSVFLSAAEAQGMPLRVVRRCDPELATSLGAQVVVVRPDQVVAWCGASPPTDADALVAVLAGRR